MTQTLTARAPRYTSYPPATHFSDDVGPDTVDDWLHQIPEGEHISLYVHVPFCRRLCWFCACRTQGTRSDAPLLPFLKTLEREIDLVAKKLAPGVRLRQIHLGGGTPTLLPAKLLTQLFDMLDARLPRTSDVEISVEIDPTELDDSRLDALVAAGITRASLGVQDFDPRVQAAIGRVQTVEQTRIAVDGLRSRGVKGVNLDLLYGLPKQTAATLDRTFDAVMDLDPDRVALYGYAHVPWASRRQVMIREADLPGPEERLRLARHAAARLQLSCYEAVGFDHFAKPGDTMARAARDRTLRRNFQGYTVDPTRFLVGLGPSAISLLPGGYAQNASRTGDWAARVRAGRMPTVRGHAMSEDDRLRGAVIERLLCDFAIDPDQFDRPAAVRAMTGEISLRWPKETTRDVQGVLRVAKCAQHMVRLLAMTLDRYAVSQDHHSLAV